MTSLPDPPPSLKAIRPYMKVASDVESSQPVVSYYMRFHALQKALEIDKKSPEARQFILSVMDFLEQFKSQSADDGIKSEVVGQSMVESYAIMLFKRADEIDRAAQFSPNLVKLFYTASLILESLSQFGQVSEEIDKVRKYSKWKAAYLTACIKSGETPMAGPPMDNPEYAEIAAAYTGGAAATSSGGGFDEDAVAPPAPKESSSSYPQLPEVPSGPPEISTSPRRQVPAIPPQPNVSSSSRMASGGGPAANLTYDVYSTAMKHCKFASNALVYEDAPTAILYLERALNLLRTGSED